AAFLFEEPELGSVIDPLAGIKDIVSRQAIAPKQVRIAEIERQAVLVGNVSSVAAGGSGKAADDRLDQFRHVLTAVDKRVAPDATDWREGRAGGEVLGCRRDRRLAVDREEGRGQIGVRHRTQVVDRVTIATNARRKLVLSADAVAECPVPLRAERQAAGLRS